MLSHISTQQDINLAKTQTEVEKLKTFRASVVTGWFGRLFMLIFVMAVFCFMMIFIRLFPNKVVLKY